MKSKKSPLIFYSLAALMMICNACGQQADQKSPSSELTALRAEIEARDVLFSEYFANKDSVGLAEFYTEDGSLGSIAGRDNLISAWNGMIQRASDSGTPKVKFITNGISTDGELVAELGAYEYMDDSGEVKTRGKYLVIWKKEDGEWKIYRDWGI